MKRHLFSLANELEAELKNYLDVLIIMNYLTVEPTTNERTTSIILNQHVPKLCSVAQMEKKAFLMQIRVQILIKDYSNILHRQRREQRNPSRGRIILMYAC